MKKDLLQELFYQVSKLGIEIECSFLDLNKYKKHYVEYVDVLTYSPDKNEFYITTFYYNYDPYVDDWVECEWKKMSEISHKEYFDIVRIIRKVGIKTMLDIIKKNCCF